MISSTHSKPWNTYVLFISTLILVFNSSNRHPKYFEDIKKNYFPHHYLDFDYNLLYSIQNF